MVLLALIALNQDVSVDPTLTTPEREEIVRSFTWATAEVAKTFPSPQRAALIVCKSDACMLEHAGPSRRSRATMTPRPTIILVESGAHAKKTMVHELLHLELARRLGAATVPAWFDEGLATFVSDNVACAGVAPVIADLRRLDSPRAWQGYTDIAGKITPTYCQAKNEVAAFAAKHSLVELVDAVAKGKRFDDLYGPLLTPGAKTSRALVAHFPLDDDSNDRAGTHMGSLMRGALWTKGKQGAGVRVKDGAHVRADGLVDLSVPDAPFSISLWVRPLARSHVLVHMAKQTSGRDGWCLPYLGHDAQGRLVAQVLTAPDPNAFAKASGPGLPMNVWSHVVMTWSAAAGVRLYVDGALVASAIAPHHFAATTPVYVFFGDGPKDACWEGGITAGSYDGVIDELRIYDYELSEPEISRNG